MDRRSVVLPHISLSLCPAISAPPPPCPKPTQPPSLRGLVAERCFFFFSSSQTAWLAARFEQRDKPQQPGRNWIYRRGPGGPKEIFLHLSVEREGRGLLAHGANRDWRYAHRCTEPPFDLPIPRRLGHRLTIGAWVTLISCCCDASPRQSIWDKMAAAITWFSFSKRFDLGHNGRIGHTVCRNYIYFWFFTDTMEWFLQMIE